MSDCNLNSLSALDGRYADQLSDLGSVLGEGAVIRYRIQVEALWLLQMLRVIDHDRSTTASEKKWINDPTMAASKDFLEKLALGQIPDTAGEAVKSIEKTTNHDVKAVEYWLRNELTAVGSPAIFIAHIHFACTSEDINNAAYGLMLKNLRESTILPMMDQIIGQLRALSITYKSLPMLSRTHGQTATPTTLGKEMAVFVWRLQRQRQAFASQEITAKFNGAVGHFNAHLAGYPQFDWIAASKAFVEDHLHLYWNPMTTQIESHDSFIEYMQHIRHFNSILLGLARDMWGYISLGYFAQKNIAGEVGSSTMPHKVNPIYFENAEGNIGIAASLFNHFAEKLPVSRWQRDLSDSTVMRVTGTAIGHSVLAWRSLLKGLDRVAVNKIAIARDLDQAWEVLAEPVQTVMRRYGVTDAYERLKTATRGEPVVTRDMIHTAIEACEAVPLSEKNRMKSWTPAMYVGLAPELVSRFIG